MTARLAVFVSGRGRTLRNLAERPELPAEVALVVGSSECPATSWARERGMRVEVAPRFAGAAEVESLLDDAGADWAALAGYTALLPIPGGWAGRVVNIHPALLPAFGGKGMYGARVHRAVLEAGCRVSGCTVHLCDGAYDEGPIVAQACCEVLDDDTPETLGARVFELERELYPRTLARLMRGRLSIDGRRARIIGA